jgi:hypothetical protein
MWTVTFRDGTLKRFKFPIRATPEGAAVPDGGFETKVLLDVRNAAANVLDNTTISDIAGLTI